jgi:hypothetical protein
VTAFRVFSGWDRRQAEAAEVFAYSVVQNSSFSVDHVYFTSADDAENTALAAFLRHQDNAGPTAISYSRGVERACSRRGVTAFTYARFMVPFLCGYEGRAAFFDGCDMLCLGDVAELADFDMQGKPMCVVKHQAEPRLMRGGRARSWSSLVLFQCDRFTRWTPDYVSRVPDDQLMRLRDFSDDEIGDLPSEWNMLCDVPGEPPEGTKLAHWSAIADPDCGDWITFSGSTVWDQWRQKWLDARKRDAGGVGAPRRQDTDGSNIDDGSTARPAA